MDDTLYTIRDKNGSPLEVIVRRDKRLKKSSRWQREDDGSILLRVPHRLPKRLIRKQVAEVETQLKKMKKRVHRRSDADLRRRAASISKKYFKGKIQWNSIRWVGNMNTRLGSCTNGGSTDGHIRISEKIKNWPQWVIDYVIAHELVHRLHSNHSKAFWTTLAAGYPKTEQARGFIQGVGFAEGQDYEAD